MDFKLLFAALGDIRNVVKTVNSLPEDYSGTLTLTLNACSYSAALRTLLSMYTLLAHPSIPAAAESVVHLLFSNSLTPSLADLFSKTLDLLVAKYAQGGVNLLPPEIQGQGERRTLECLWSDETMEECVKTMRQEKNLEAARYIRQAVQLSKERASTRERYMVALRPPHRLGYMQYRLRGVLLPFGDSDAQFTVPNLTMYASAGNWQYHDEWHPLQGWDMQEVLQAGFQHNCPPSDIYGSLFFYLRSQFITFATRLRSFHVKISLYHASPEELDFCLGIGMGRLGSSFDRIDFGRVMDEYEDLDAEYAAAHGTEKEAGQGAGVARRSSMHHCLIKLGRHLEEENDYAAVVVPLVDWAENRQGACIDTASTVDKKKAVALAEEFGFKGEVKGADNTDEVLRDFVLNAFYNNDVAFDKYLNDEHDSDCCYVHLKMRDKNRIVPKRVGAELNEEKWSAPKGSMDDFYWRSIVPTVSSSERCIEFQFHGQKTSDRIREMFEGGTMIPIADFMGGNLNNWFNAQHQQHQQHQH
jgi:hypothetical protein